MLERLRMAVRWLVLVGLVVVTLLTTVFLDQRSQIFLLKLVLAAVFTVLPGCMYLLFIASKGQRLYDEFVLNLFRLRIDKIGNLPAPPQHTTYFHDWEKAHQRVMAHARAATKDNLYRAKFEAIYGPDAVSTKDLLRPERDQARQPSGVGRPPRPSGPVPGAAVQDGVRRTARDRTQTFIPILLLTFLLGIGWALVIQPESFGQYHLAPSPNGVPHLPYEALTFGFIGAYWFILQDVVRRYYRDDLKTSAYISAVTRLVVVAVLVTTIGLVPLGTVAQQQVFAFFVGVFPQVGVEFLKAGVHKTLGAAVPTLDTKHPLSRLQGLTIWDQARLLEEGIEDLENLATANLVDVLLSMRLPVARLVDWVDQAILLIHLPFPEHPPGRSTGRGWRRRGRRTGAADDVCAHREDSRDRLQRLGIRTATDLEAAWHVAPPEGREAISRAALGSDAGLVEGCLLLTVIGREANIDHIRAFRCRDWLDGPKTGARPGAAGGGFIRQRPAGTG